MDRTGPPKEGVWEKRPRQSGTQREMGQVTQEESPGGRRDTEGLENREVGWGVSRMGRHPRQQMQQGGRASDGVTGNRAAFALR